MPAILRSGPYRVYFYSHEPNEPPHVHVDSGGQSAKFWIDPISLAKNLGYSAKELGKVEKLLTEHEGELLEAWNDHFGK